MANLDPQQVAQSFRFDPQAAQDLRARWLRLVDLGVWGDLKSPRLGALARMRKRLLETGENLRSLLSDRSWIPQPREQVKSALGACVKLRDGLLDLERAARLVEGGADFARFESELLALRAALLRLLEHHERAWAELLEGLYADPEDGAGEGD